MARLARLITHANKVWGPLCLLILPCIYFLIPISVGVSDSPARSTQILDRNGILLREIRPEGRGVPISLDKTHPFSVEALIATEDRTFYNHNGISTKSLARAFVDNITAREIISGASTITMQVARMHLGHMDRSPIHKIHEMALAVRMELHNSKEDILTAWLNNAYFGNQAYGIESASQLYFGKSAIDLTKTEAAYLIGLPQNPVGYNPYRYPGKAIARFNRVLTSLVETTFMTELEATELRDVPIALLPVEDAFYAPHFLEWIQAESNGILDQATYTTSLDAHLQAEIEALARGHLKRLNSEYVSNAAAIVIDNTTGEVLAYMGSVDFWDEQHEGQNDGVRMLRQPGSTLKPFTYALALASREYTAASVLADIEVQIPEAGGAFAPKNYDKTYHGPVPLRHALANSYNVPAVRLARDLGIPQLLDLLKDIGFVSLNRPASHYGAGLTLGNGEVRLLELAQAYATLARLGHPLTLKTVVSTASQTAYTTPVLEPEIAYLISHILSDPEAREAAFGRHGPLELPFPAAVKTGTSKDYRDNWAVGYTPRHTVAVWVGNFDGSPMQKVSGVTGAGPLFKSIMLSLGSAGHFDQPGVLSTALVCPLSGKKPSTSCPLTRQEMFLPGTLPTDTCTVHQHHLIDRRSNLLASASTPKTSIAATLFTVLPDIYHPWMRDNGIALPPTAYAAEAKTPELIQEKKGGLKIAYPVSGMIFQLDPILRDNFQKITIEGIIPEGITGTSWWINGELWESNKASTNWPLYEGVHTIELRGKDESGGASVQIQVVK